MGVPRFGQPVRVISGGGEDALGDPTETAPGTDTASSGLNGRLQRIAQRLTSLIALLPASIGQKTAAGSTSVVLASDQPALPITGTITTTGNYSAVAPAGQVSTASLVVLAGSEFDARTWISLAYTIAVATEAVTWSVFGANASDYSDEIVVSAGASVAAAAASSYAVALAPYAYYRVKIIDTAAGTHGTATVRGIVKA